MNQKQSKTIKKPVKTFTNDCKSSKILRKLSENRQKLAQISLNTSNSSKPVKTYKKIPQKTTLTIKNASKIVKKT